MIMGEYKYPLGKVINLGSSSKGNSYLIEIHRKDYPNPFRIMIELGLDSEKQLSQRLLNHGMSITNVDAFLITHEHLDHARLVKDFVKKGKKVYAPNTVFERHCEGIEIENKYVIKEQTIKSITDGIKVYGFPLDHENDDGSSTYNLGYIITIDNWFNILFVTDTKHIRFDLSEFQFNVIFIEANNTHRVIANALKNAQEHNDRLGTIHYSRVLKSHMLVEKTAKTLATFDLRKTDKIYLIHLSAFTQVNPYEFKGIVVNSMIKYNQLREITYKNTEGKTIKTKLPKVLVAKRNGDWT